MSIRFYALIFVCLIFNQQVIGQCWLTWQTRKAVDFPVEYYSFIDPFTISTTLAGQNTCNINAEYSSTPPLCYEPTPPGYYCYGFLCVQNQCKGAYNRTCHLLSICGQLGFIAGKLNPILGGVVAGICAAIPFVCVEDSSMCWALDAVIIHYTPIDAAENYF